MQQKSPKVFNRIELVIKSVMPYFERFDLVELMKNITGFNTVGNNSQVLKPVKF